MTKLEPPLRVNNISILGIDLVNKALRIIVHLKKGENPNAPDINSKIITSIKYTVRYMELEKFIPEKCLWKPIAGIINE